MNKNVLNRRHEQRISLHGLNLKIRKAGLGKHLQNYETCQSVDLSLNGLAFATGDNLVLKVPEKIEFILSIEGHEIIGNGVVCNKRQTESGTQYGLMFLACTPEISSVFDFGELSSHELDNLAVNMAEQFVYSLMKKRAPAEKLMLSKQQQLFDACRSYLRRLGEMGIRMQTVEPDILQHPVQAVQFFRDPQQNLLLHWYNSDTHQSEQMSIKVQHNDQTVSFMIDQDLQCKTVLQVLELLGKKINDSVRFT